jgi:hypothetical protein
MKPYERILPEDKKDFDGISNRSLELRITVGLTVYTHDNTNIL